MRGLGPYQPRSVDALFRGNLISGLALSQAADVSHDVTISAGAVRQESGTENYRIDSALTKQIDAAWAEGTDQGGLDGTESVPGTPDASTWYHLWLIHNSTTNATDALFSESATSPTLPSGWTWERRLGSVLTDGSANITPFHSYETFGGGLKFVRDVVIRDINDSNPGTGAQTNALSVPTGFQVEAEVTWFLQSSGITISLLATEIDQAASTPSGSIFDLFVNGANQNPVIHKRMRTDTSAQVRYEVDASNAGTVVFCFTHGWIDPRLV